MAFLPDWRLRELKWGTVASRAWRSQINTKISSILGYRSPDRFAATGWRARCGKKQFHDWPITITGAYPRNKIMMDSTPLKRLQQSTLNLRAPSAPLKRVVSNISDHLCCSFQKGTNAYNPTSIRVRAETQNLSAVLGSTLIWWDSCLLCHYNFPCRAKLVFTTLEQTVMDSNAVVV